MNIGGLTLSATVILEEPTDVSDRLAELGWTENELVEIVRAMVAGRFGCTANDPSGAPGWMAYKEGIRRMREIGITKGLRRSNVDQVPWTVDLERGLRFSVVNSNDATGVPTRDPQNRNKRGAAAERAVYANAEQACFDFPDRPLDEGDDVLIDRTLGAVAWYLFSFAEGDTVRAELSCPVEMSNGFFCRFSERIFLGADMFRPLRDATFVQDAEDEFDIAVERLEGP